MSEDLKERLEALAKMLRDRCWEDRFADLPDEALAALTSMGEQEARLRADLVRAAETDKARLATITTLREEVARKDEALRGVQGQMNYVRATLAITPSPYSHECIATAENEAQRLINAALSPEPEAAPLPHVPGAGATEGSGFTRDEIMAALEPFADASRHIHPVIDDDDMTLDGIEVRHWRRAGIVFADRQGKQARDLSEL